ncbi:MAG: tetratricopeptide repeat protein [Desulfuromusa sp.]|nr:tetratricopeptide repeat protein [Desulfuromusa sp.]
MVKVKRMNKVFITLLFLLTLLSGCVPGGKVVPEPDVEIPSSSAGSTVAQFDDGRRGFIITEAVNLDGATRRDFDQAVVFLNNRDFDQAIGLLEKLIETSPRVTAPYINLALAYRKVGKPDPAEEHLKIALELLPGHPVASNEYGLLLRKAGRFVEARNIYEQALTKFPDYLPVRKNLGILCDIYLNDLECAMTQYQLYNEANRADEQVKLWISELRLRLGQ